MAGAPNEQRRDPVARQAILTAARELADELGYARLTIEGVAKRAGVGKQTIYRWWPSLHAVVLDAVFVAGQTSAEFPDTGDLGADLRTQMNAVVAAMSGEVGRIYRGLIGAAQTDDALATDLYRRIVAPRVAACRVRIEAAQRSGQVRTDVDPETIVEILYAPLYYRLLLGHRRVSTEQVDAVVAVVLDAVGGPAQSGPVGSARRRT